MKYNPTLVDTTRQHYIGGTDAADPYSLLMQCLKVWCTNDDNSANLIFKTYMGSFKIVLRLEL